MDDWQQAGQFNSPQSVRQAVILGIVAVFLVIGFCVVRSALPSLAEHSTRLKATPCRSA